MATHPKAENGKTKKEGETPAPEKATGKRKIKNDDVSEKLPITHSPTSKSHNHQNNGTKSKSKSSEEETQVANGIDGSKKKRKKEVKEDKNHKKKVKEDDDSLLYQIPMSRVSRIIKSEDPNIRVTQEALYIINKASEKFLQVFTTEAYANSFLDHKKYIDYKHLSLVVIKRRRFDFLSDFVPEKMKAEDALVEAQAVEDWNGSLDQ